MGALYIADSSSGTQLDARSVDAIASLAAISLERAHSFIAESNAEAAKRSEQLRSTVLDGLAHAFKTPLATIQAQVRGCWKSTGSKVRIGNLCLSSMKRQHVWLS